MTRVVTSRSLLEAARSARRPGLSSDQAVVIGFSHLVGEPLDPFVLDDAALILRAESLLLLEGLGIADAVRAARDEHATWSAS